MTRLEARVSKLEDVAGIDRPDMCGCHGPKFRLFDFWDDTELGAELPPFTVCERCGKPIPRALYGVSDPEVGWLARLCLDKWPERDAQDSSIPS